MEVAPGRRGDGTKIKTVGTQMSRRRRSRPPSQADPPSHREAAMTPGGTTIGPPHAASHGQSNGHARSLPYPCRPTSSKRRSRRARTTVATPPPPHKRLRALARAAQHPATPQPSNRAASRQPPRHNLGLTVGHPKGVHRRHPTDLGRDTQIRHQHGPRTPPRSPTSREGVAPPASQDAGVKGAEPEESPTTAAAGTEGRAPRRMPPVSGKKGPRRTAFGR